jgi:hypothetical protein
MSTHEVTKAINAYLWKDRRLETNVDHRFVAGYEAGRHHWPRTHYRDAFCHVLKVKTDAELGFYKQFWTGPRYATRYGPVTGPPRSMPSYGRPERRRPTSPQPSGCPNRKSHG